MQISSNLFQPLATISNRESVYSFDRTDDFPIQTQRMSNWCWAACTVSLCTFYQRPGPLSQQQHVSRILGLPACNNFVPLPLCNKTHDFADSLREVDHLSGNPIDNPLSPAAIIKALAQSGPIGCQINIPDFGTHVVILCESSRQVGNDFFVRIADPFDGSLRVIPYAEFSNNYRGAGGSWVRTFLTS